ncbi:SET domain-containing protein [Annulohypoxylon bovei var. microspora]|nr:SET domain-containing protein [Annulohypoxylon bovei var. microspora]
MASLKQTSVGKGGAKSRKMIEVRRLGSDGGEAVFAAVDIRRGTRFAAEVPLITVPPVSDRDELSAFYKATDNLPNEKSAEMAKLFCQPIVTESIKKDQHIRREAWGFFKARRWRDKDGNHLQGKKLNRAVKRIINLCAVYIAQNVQLGAEGKYGSGVFSLYSRISHSCVPNAHNSWNPTLKRLTIHAIHDLKAGDQIFVDYTGSVCRTRQQRAFSLSTTWGITCSCAACTEPAIDQLRLRMLVMDQALAAYTCGASKDPDFSAIHGIPRIATASQALKAAEELSHLLKKQRLCGMELCKVFRECSKYAFDAGHHDKALEYARKELDLEKLLIGTETAHLKDNLYGAKYWVEHIRKKVTRKPLRVLNY